MHRSTSTRSSATSPTSRSRSPASTPARTGPTRSPAPTLPRRPARGRRRRRRPTARRAGRGSLALARHAVWRLRRATASRFVVHRVRRARARRGTTTRGARPAVRLRTAEDVARELGNMKGALMKFGQLLSFIIEALPDDAQQALSSLQADAPPMSPSWLPKVVADELGQPPERIFLDWQPTPVAAASVGQVHRAVTRDGRRVAVKVQYPGVGDAIDADLDNAEALYRLFSAFVLKGLDTKGLVDELRARMRDELDYGLEAANQTRVRRATSPSTRSCRIPARRSGDQHQAGADHRVGRRSVVGRVPSSRRARRRATAPANRSGASPSTRSTASVRSTATRTPATTGSAATATSRSSTSAWSSGGRPDEWHQLAPSLDAIVVHRDPERLVTRDGGDRLPPRRPRPAAAAGVRLRQHAVHAVPHRRVHVHARLRARRDDHDHRRQGTARRGHRAAQHAAELRHPRPCRVGCQRDPRQARGHRAVAGDAARVPRRRPPATPLGEAEREWALAAGRVQHDPPR